MFGLIPKKRPFGAPPAQNAPEPVAGQRSGGGLFGSAPQAQAKKPSVLPYALAALEDTMARQMGYQPQGVSRLNDMNAQRQQEAAALAEEQRKRSMGLEDYEAKKQIDQRYESTAPAKDPEVVRLSQIANDLNRPEYERRAAAAAVEARNTQWIRTVDPLTGAITLQPSPSSAAPPPDMLPPDFDFGEGGPASQAPGGFPAGR